VLLGGREVAFWVEQSWIEEPIGSSGTARRPMFRVRLEDGRRCHLAREPDGSWTLAHQVSGRQLQGHPGARGDQADGRAVDKRHDVVAAAHADLLHQRVHQGLAHRQRPVLDRRADPLQQLGRLLRVRCGIVRGDQQVAQLLLAGLELDQLGGERLDAPAALLLAQGASFEGVQVAVDGRFGLADLAADRAALPRAST
jgi:hypothetical protein